MPMMLPVTKLFTTGAPLRLAMAPYPLPVTLLEIVGAPASHRTPTCPPRIVKPSTVATAAALTTWPYVSCEPAWMSVTLALGSLSDRGVSPQLGRAHL